MTLQIEDDRSGPLALGANDKGLNRPARASIRLSWRTTRFEADAEITPLGLLAIGGMVGAILLAVTPIVSAAAQAKRRR